MADFLYGVARTLHVPILLISYAIFLEAFVIGIVYLWQERQMKSKHPHPWFYRIPSLEQLDACIFKLITAAVPLLTVGILLGGLWAQRVWGRFWGWDPKETSALVTWSIYVAYLMIRLVAGWRGRKTAYLSLVGFALVLITCMGVNYMSPLHGFLSGVAR